MTICTPRADLPFVSLFNRAAFHALNAAPGDAILALPYDEDGRTVGVLSGVQREGAFTAGFSSPCSGPDFARPARDARPRRGGDRPLAGRARRPRAEHLTFRCPPAPGRRPRRSCSSGCSTAASRSPRPTSTTPSTSAASRLADAYLAALSRLPPRAAPRPRGAVRVRRARGPHDRVRARGRQPARPRPRAQPEPGVLRARPRALPGSVRCFVLEHEGAARRRARHGRRRRPLVRAGVGRRGPPARALADEPARVPGDRTGAGRGRPVVDLGRTTEPGGPPLRVSHGLAQFKQSILAAPELRPVLVR